MRGTLPKAVALPFGDISVTSSPTRSPRLCSRRQPTMTVSSENWSSACLAIPLASSGWLAISWPRKPRTETPIEPRGPPSRIDRSQQRKRERHRHDRNDVGCINSCRNLREEILLGVEEVDVEDALQKTPDRLDVISEFDTDDEAGEGADDADAGP